MASKLIFFRCYLLHFYFYATAIYLPWPARESLRSTSSDSEIRFDINPSVGDRLLFTLHDCFGTRIKSYSLLFVWFTTNKLFGDLSASMLGEYKCLSVFFIVQDSPAVGEYRTYRSRHADLYFSCWVEKLNSREKLSE